MSDGASCLVFDVRNDPGGQLTELVSILDYLLKMKEQGVVRHIGASSHTPSVIHEILDAGIIVQDGMPQLMRNDKSPDDLREIAVDGDHLDLRLAGKESFSRLQALPHRIIMDEDPHPFTQFVYVKCPVLLLQFPEDIDNISIFHCPYLPSGTGKREGASL